MGLFKKLYLEKKKLKFKRVILEKKYGLITRHQTDLQVLVSVKFTHPKKKKKKTKKKKHKEETPS